MIKYSFKSILIVEDEFMALEYLKDILIELGFENIRIAKNSDDAVSLVQNNDIELVFMDININGKTDGIICAKLINEIKPIPIIYTTAFVDDETIEEANLTNIYGYIMKPFSYKDVKSVLTIATNFINKDKKQSKEQQNLLSDNDSSEKIILHNNYCYHVSIQTLTHKEKPVVLSKRESAIMNLLCININQIITYENLMLNIWKDKNISLSTVRDAVSRLKKKLPELSINNISGAGYSLIN